MNTNEMIKVMQAYQAGEEIQVRPKDSYRWSDTENPQWDWLHFDYQVKPKTKVVNTTLYVAVLKKNSGGYIATNPRTLYDYQIAISGYKRSATLVKEFTLEFQEEVPYDD